MKKGKALLCALAALSLCGCGGDSEEMRYIKTSELYDTITDMYQHPDDYVGQNYHMVGTLYPAKDSAGETFYSIYAEGSDGGEGIGIELSKQDMSGFSDYDTVTVEGKLTVESDGDTRYLLLNTTLLEKRQE